MSSLLGYPITVYTRRRNIRVISRACIPLALNGMHILAVDLGTDLVPALGLGLIHPSQASWIDRHEASESM